MTAIGPKRANRIGSWLVRLLQATALIAGQCAHGALAQPAQPPPPPDPAFEAFLAGLRAEAAAQGISPATLERTLGGVVPEPQVIDLSGRQPEHERTAGQYVALLVSPERIAAGRLKLAEARSALAAAEARFGVERHVLAAIWGVETNYGERRGERPVIRSLATLAFADPRRPAFWRGELLAALRILEAGDVAAERMLGSWAGAMGHTQFMPSTYLRHAVDLDGDGRRDVWDNAGDALGSAAAYLAASGWVKGQPWGFEVELPAGFDHGLSAPGQARPATGWQGLGVARPHGRPWPSSRGDLALLLPAGATGPAFLASQGFRAILRYNASTAYALAVGLLADALAGDEAAAQVRWPADDRALSRAEREELQRLLSARGHDTGTPDGIIGAQSRAAIRAYQRRVGVAADGHASHGLLERLRSGPD